MVSEDKRVLDRRKSEEVFPVIQPFTKRFSFVSRVLLLEIPSQCDRAFLFVLFVQKKTCNSGWRRCCV